MSSRRRSILQLHAQRETSHILREMTGRQHALLAGRGAAGIWAALRALGLRDEYVMIPANTCYIVLWAVLKSGNKPLLVDVDEKTGNLNTEKIFHHRETGDTEKKAKAVIPCHMYGIGAEIEQLCAWAKAGNIYVIEDAALALGEEVEGRPAGSWGDVSILSFGLGKIADNQVGGAVLTDDDHLAAEIEKVLAEMPVWDDHLMGLTNQWNAIYWALHQYEDANPRLPDLYPSLYAIYGDLTGYRLAAEDWREMPEMLRTLPENLAHRRTMARIYDERLTPSQVSEDQLRTFPRDRNAGLWRYPLRVRADVRDELLHYLWENGIQDATRWYPPLRYMTAALAPDVPQTPTPNADALGAGIINLRVDPGIDEAYVHKTAHLIEAFFA